MDKILLLGQNRFSYNNRVALDYLEANCIDHDYKNFKDYAEEDTPHKTVIVLDDNVPIRVHELDFLPSSNLSFVGKTFHKLKSSKVSTYNNIINHFRCYNKWHVYNLLSHSALPVLPTVGIGKHTNLKDPNSELLRLKPPFYVRDMDSYSILCTSNKLNFISHGIDDLIEFYNEHLSESWDTYIVQEYKPHNSVVAAHYMYGDIRFTEENAGIHSPLINTNNMYISIVKAISDRIKLNCFSTYFIDDRIIKLKAPMCFEVVDTVFNINSINTFLETVLNA